MTIPASIALVDLSCLFKRNFMAQPDDPRAAADKTLSELAAVRESVAHVILCLDTPPYDRRKAIYPDYKANRTPAEASEKAQKRRLYDECKRLGYQMARVRGEEADDVIATLARAYGERCPDVRLVGADKDLAQCVTQNVRQMVPAIGERAAELRGPDRVLEKYGVHPHQIPLYLALVGDKSDNVPGVPGIGPVKAVALIAEHKTHFHLGEALALRPKAPSGVWKALQDHWNQFEMSLELVKLRTDLPLEAAALLARLEPAPVEVMGAKADVTLDGFMGNEAPMPEQDYSAMTDELRARARAEGARLADISAEQQHDAEQDHEEGWRKQMREEMNDAVATAAAEAVERKAAGKVDPTGRATERGAANDVRQKLEPMPAEPAGPKGASPTGAPTSAGGARNVTEAEFDPIGRSPGASGPLPPLPPKEVKVPAAKEQKAIEKQAVDYGLVSADLQPQDLRSAEVIAKWIVASGLYPQFRTPAAVFAVIMRGKELGLGVTTALAGFHVVEGKPVASADLIRSLAQRSPKCKYFRLVHSDDSYAEWETLHADHPEPTRYRYTIEEAQKAGLRGGNWEKRKRDMLTKTAASKLARIVFPGETLGLYAQEEFSDAYGEAA
jgi:5'-3' exonuclease